MIFKSLHIRGSFVVEYVYPLLIYPSVIIEIPKKSQIVDNNYTGIELYDYQNYWTVLYDSKSSNGYLYIITIKTKKDHWICFFLDRSKEGQTL